MLLALSAQATAFISGPPGSMGSARALYGDTSFISSLRFLDANGSPIAISYTTATGLSYPMAVQAVPGPEIAGLLLAGIGLMAVVARRRRGLSRTQTCSLTERALEPDSMFDAQSALSPC